MSGVKYDKVRLGFSHLTQFSPPIPTSAAKKSPAGENHLAFTWNKINWRRPTVPGDCKSVLVVPGDLAYPDISTGNCGGCLHI